MINQFRKLAAVFSYINQHPLAGRHRLIAYTKFVKWQLVQLFSPGQKIVPFVGDTRLSVNKGMTGATGNIYLGLHDFSDMGFLLHFLRKGDVFADVGANIGSYSILSSGVTGANTVAFEPFFKTFEQLKKNISINKIENNIKAFNLALGSKADRLFFTTALDTVNHVVPNYELQTKGNRVEVEVETLDNIADNEGCPALIKIDVEGYETEVVNGMEKTLASQQLKAIIIELNGSGMRYGYNEEEIHNKLLCHHFLPYSYDPYTRSFTQSNGHGAHNTLYVRDVEFVKKRVESAEKITVFNESF